tara:strand:+ start:575 stop:775 length:201 start_codon:yes stop_codon:yes gene_type:complete
MNKDKIEVGDLVVHTGTSLWRIVGPGLVVGKRGHFPVQFHVMWLNNGYVRHDYLPSYLRKLEIPNE